MNLIIENAMIKSDIFTGKDNENFKTAEHISNAKHTLYQYIVLSLPNKKLDAEE